MSDTSEETGTGEGGAQAAIAGFLYEVVGILGLQVVTDRHVEVDEDEDFAAFVRVSDGVLWHERWGQDAATLPPPIEGDKVGGGLIQFKFALDPSSKPIQPAHLKVIAQRLHDSAQAAMQDGHQIVHYALVSNRPLSKEAPALLERARRGEPTDDVSKGAANVLARLRPIVGKPFSFWYEAVETFMIRYGATLQERHAAITRLVGERFFQVKDGQRVPVDVSDYRIALLGLGQARSLTSSDREGAAEQALAALPEKRPGIVEREALRELGDLVQRRALIAVSGPGGVGKTTAVVHWLHDVAQHAGQGMLMWLKAEWIAPAPIAAALRRYMGFPDTMSDWIPTDPTALMRLEIANPGDAHPVLLLALDAADEPAGDAHWHAHVAALLRSFAASDKRALAGELPHATLVVTCRTVADLRRFWLLDEYQQPARHDAFADVVLGRFSDDELSEAAAYVTDRVRTRIVQGLLGSQEERPEIPTVGSAVTEHVGVPDDLAWRKHLSHPVLWGLFSAMAEDLQNGVLDGEEAALRVLARDFIELFCIKARDRKRAGEQTVDDLSQTLRYIAESAAYGLAHERRLWEDRATAAGNTKPIAFFSEAVGYGLVEQVDNTRWRWEHEFVQRYLTVL